jgi:hypothetical protein
MSIERSARLHINRYEESSDTWRVNRHGDGFGGAVEGREFANLTTRRENDSMGRGVRWRRRQAAIYSER